MSSEESNVLEANKALVQRLCDEVINQANREAAMEIISPDYEIIFPDHRNLWPDLEAASTGSEGTTEPIPTGPEGVVSLIERFRNKYEGLRAEIEGHLAAEGNVVVTIFRIQCVVGEGQSFFVVAIVANVISDGKIERSIVSFVIQEGGGGIWRWPFW